MYDPTNTKSLENLEYWLNQAKTYGAEDALMMVFCNKADSVVVDDMIQKGRDFAETHDLSFELVSAKTGQNVQEAFAVLVERILLKTQDPVEMESSGVPLKTLDDGIKKGCC